MVIFGEEEIDKEEVTGKGLGGEILGADNDPFPDPPGGYFGMITWQKFIKLCIFDFCTFLYVDYSLIKISLKKYTTC